LARAALGKKQLCDQSINDLVPIYQQAHTTADKLRDQLKTLKTKLDETKTKQSTLIARSQAAKAQKNISKSLNGMGDDAFGSFDKYEKKIETMESEAEALGMLSDEDVSLDDEFKKLGANSDVDTDLDALRAKMGILPKADDHKQLPE
jgi:phage shock protein A